MKKIILFFLIILFIGSGCYSLKYMKKSFEVGQEIEADIGNAMITFEFFGGSEGFRQELIYSGINNKTISILYREYTVNLQGTFIKEGYTNQATYD